MSSNSNSSQSNNQATDHVFPISSVVSVDPTATPLERSEGKRDDGFPGMILPEKHSNVDVSKARLPSHQTLWDNLPSANTSSSSAETNSQLYRITNTNSTATLGNRFNSLGSGDCISTTRSSSITEKAERTEGSPHSQTGADDLLTKPDNTANIAGGSNDETSVSLKNAAKDTDNLYTARFKHVITDGGHAVIIGRDGDTLQRCEDEPIHIPGAIQSFGLLFALREDDDGKLKVRIVSENSKQLIGYTPQEIFALDSFCDILSDAQTDNLLDHLDFIREDDTNPVINGPEVFTLVIRLPNGRNQKMWCAMHVNPSNNNLIICEFELEDDHINPLVPAGSLTPELPEDTLQSNPTAEEYAESTSKSSRPLRVLKNARRRNGEAAAMEVFNIMSQVQEQLANAPNIEIFLKVLVGVVKELTGFHRVMIYQFDQAWNGKVVTELVDPRATKDLYKGLNFPASDIPKQARDLYKINKVRLLYDRDQLTARLVCRTTDDLESPLDLTFAYLRAMSPIHIKYLANMAVRASMSISISTFGELWGLIACHTYGPKGMRVSFPIRKMCRLVGDAASRNIERLSYAARLQVRKLINTVPTKTRPSSYIIASSDDLLQLFDADFGLLSVSDETKVLGELEQTREALAMLEYLRLRKFTSIMISADIKLDFPDLRYSPGFTVIVGLLLIPFSLEGDDFIVFFRKGKTQEVKWAGNPYEKFIREGTDGYLEPRKSFATYRETVFGAREWTEQECESASVLSLIYGKFINVWKSREKAIQDSQLTKLLLANTAHEVRTPLNAVINYLEIALEGAIDQDTRENLSKSHSASKSLIYVINDLLDLTKTEKGHNLIKDEAFDLPFTFHECAKTFAGDARRKNITYDVIENPGIPKWVIGDQRRVRQAISNVIANAIQHTSAGSVIVELCSVECTPHRVEVDIVVQDTGVGMSENKLDRLYQELEQVQSVSEEGLQQQTKPESDMRVAVGEEKTLGLGLALVARIVRTMNGQLRLKSEEGKGSRFVVQLGFDLPDYGGSAGLPADPKAASVIPPTQPTTPPLEAGEVTLVHRSAQKVNVFTSPTDVSRRGSNESIKKMRSSMSLKSFKSGSSGMSDMDRLIEDFQGPRIAPTTSASPDNRASRPESRSKGRPRVFSRSHAQEGDEDLEESVQGESFVSGLMTPITPTRILDEANRVLPAQELSPTYVRFPFDASNQAIKLTELPKGKNFHILVAEDDPINSKIVKKRLEKLGHSVHLTVNGEECSSAYGERPESFDVLLMDMQMPIVDGLTSTKMIRSYEKSHSRIVSSHGGSCNGRVPVFAVSASLVERDRQVYMDAGFDGWILKPIDFKRLGELLSGVVERDTRERCLYERGQWERGGWFATQQPDIFTAATVPSGGAPRFLIQPGALPSLPVDEDIFGGARPSGPI